MGRLEIVAHRATERLASELRRFDRSSIGDRVLHGLDRTALAASTRASLEGGLTACLRYARPRPSAHPHPRRENSSHPLGEPTHSHDNGGILEIDRV